MPTGQSGVEDSMNIPSMTAGVTIPGLMLCLGSTRFMTRSTGYRNRAGNAK
jgi:hypothetical protein